MDNTRVEAFKQKISKLKKDNLEKDIEHYEKELSKQIMIMSILLKEKDRRKRKKVYNPTIDLLVLLRVSMVIDFSKDKLKSNILDRLYKIIYFVVGDKEECKMHFNERSAIGENFLP